MSERYEWIEAPRTPVQYHSRSWLLGFVTEEHALVIGDPDGTALVVDAHSKQELIDLIDRMRQAIESTPITIEDEDV